MVKERTEVFTAINEIIGVQIVVDYLAKLGVDDMLITDTISNVYKKLIAHQVDITEKNFESKIEETIVMENVVYNFIEPKVLDKVLEEIIVNNNDVVESMSFRLHEGVKFDLQIDDENELTTIHKVIFLYILGSKSL